MPAASIPAPGASPSGAARPLRFSQLVTLSLRYNTCHSLHCPRRILGYDLHMKWIFHTLVAAMLAQTLYAAPTTKTVDVRQTLLADAVAFAHAIDVGDEMTAKEFAFGGEKEMLLLESMAALTRSEVHLLKVAKQRFGEDGKGLAGGVTEPGLEGLVKESTIELDHDTAIVRQNPTTILLNLKLSDGKWLVDISGSIERDALRQIPLLQNAAKATDLTAQEIIDGGYASAAAARDGLTINKATQGKGLPVSPKAATRPNP